MRTGFLIRFFYRNQILLSKICDEDLTTLIFITILILLILLIFRRRMEKTNNLLNLEENQDFKNNYVLIILISN